jgi:methionine sulfoxide reductase heme-binding subunit
MNTWNILRAAGIGAYLMLWASVTWGLMSTTQIFGKKISKQTNIAFHQAFSTCGLLLLAAHLGFLLADSFMPFTWLDLIVPMRASYRPLGVALGIGAMFVMILGVLGTSWGRKLIGTKWWRRMHSLSVPAFTLALVHGLMTGTDTRRPAMFWMYVATAAVLLFLLVVRALTVGERPQRAKLPEGVVRRTPASAIPVAEPVAAAVAPTALPATLPPPPPAVAEPEPERGELPAAASITTDRGAHPRRSPWAATQPVPIVFVRSELAAAPPTYRIVNRAGEHTGPPPETPRIGRPSNGDHTAQVIRVATDRYASNGPANGDPHVSANGHADDDGHPSPEGEVLTLAGSTHPGHAPQPHPKTRSPDRRAC